MESPDGEDMTGDPSLELQTCAAAGRGSMLRQEMDAANRSFR